MAKIFDWVIRHYGPIAEKGEDMGAGDSWGYMLQWCRQLALLKAEEKLKFCYSVSVEPMETKAVGIFAEGTIHGYKVKVGEQEHRYQIEPRVRERKSQAWCGL